MMMMMMLELYSAELILIQNRTLYALDLKKKKA